MIVKGARVIKALNKAGGIPGKTFLDNTTLDMRFTSFINGEGKQVDLRIPCRGRVPIADVKDILDSSGLPLEKVLMIEEKLDI